MNTNDWIKQRIKPEEVEKYIGQEGVFINDKAIDSALKKNSSPDKKRLEDILAKSLSIVSLSADETAALVNAREPWQVDLMQAAALQVKKKVYDNRIVTFAPLYLGNNCVNDCLYCGFRDSNKESTRKTLNLEEVRQEIKVLAGEIGHKRLIAVYGEHPLNDIDYMLETIKAIYDVKVRTKHGIGAIRRVNVNAAPMQVAELRRLKEAGLGTYQVFQETYHKKTYEALHPSHTVKGDYLWRLYVMHRALEAGIDDVGLGALFGLYDWRYEVMALVEHDRALEKRFGIGAHTISFPRLEPAQNSPYAISSKYRVSDDDFKHIMLVIRLSVPHVGMIITARETPQMRHDSIALGITQTDASTKIGVGAYADRKDIQEDSRQQFILGDTRSLDELIREFSAMGYITSFCTAGYRCGRTGDKIMGLLRSGKEGKFCKLNAVLTFREWLDDFASDDTRRIAEPLIEKEMHEIKATNPEMYGAFMKAYEKIKNGTRDLYF